MSVSSSISLKTYSRGNNGIRGQTSHQTAIRRNSASNLGSGSSISLPSPSISTSSGLVSSNSPVASPTASQPGTPPPAPPPTSNSAGAGTPTPTPNASDQANSIPENKEAWYRKSWTFINSFLNFTNVAIIISLGIIGILAYKYQVQSQGLAVWNARKDFQASCLARKEAGESLSSACRHALEQDYLREPPTRRDTFWSIAKIPPLLRDRIYPASGALYDGILSRKALLILLDGIAEVVTLSCVGIAIIGLLSERAETPSRISDGIGFLCFLAFWYLPILPACQAHPLLSRFLFGPTSKAERTVAMAGVVVFCCYLVHKIIPQENLRRRQPLPSNPWFDDPQQLCIDLVSRLVFFYAGGVSGLVLLLAPHFVESFKK